MKWLRAIIPALLCILVGCRGPVAEPDRVQLGLYESAVVPQASEASLGERVDVWIDAVHPAGSEILPAEILLHSNLVVLSRAMETVGLGDHLATRQRFTVAAFELGPVPLTVGDLVCIESNGEERVIALATQFLDIVSVLNPEEEQLVLPTGMVMTAEDPRLAARGEHLRDTAKDLRDTPRSPRPWWMWVFPPVIGLLLLAICLAWLLRPERKPLIPPKPPPGAAELARRELGALRASGHAEAGRHEPFYVELSSIVRRYLERRFGLHAPDRTTEEFLREASAGRQLGRPHQVLVGEFLQESDLVKFACARPGPSEMRQAFGAAERLVEETAVADPALGETGP